MPKPHLSVIVGSNSKESINRKYAQALAKLAADKFDVHFVRIDDDLPLFNQDHEANPVPEVARFKDEITRADGILIVTPEHNRSISTALKNAIDWGARPAGTNRWAGKSVFITGASPGALGTALAQLHLRSMLGASLGANIMGGEAYISFKPNLFDNQGNIGDDSTRKFLQGFIDRFATFVSRLSGKA